MADREKVIRAVDSCFDYWLDQHRCLNPLELEHVRQYKADALAMLKEQEPQLVLNIGEQIFCKSGSCPKCGKMLNTTCNKRYCGDCGQAVKWE